jgi:hypothetical protein
MLTLNRSLLTLNRSLLTLSAVSAGGGGGSK